MYINKDELFSVAYFIFGSFFLLQQTTYFKIMIPNFFTYVVVVIVTFILMLKETGDLITTKKMHLTIPGLIMAIFFLALSAKEMSNSSGSVFLLTCILIFSARDIKLDSILKPFLLFSSFIFVITLFSSKIGLIQNMISYQHRWRSSMGFSYVSFAAQLCFYFVLAYVVYRNTKLSYREIFFLFFIVLFIYYKTVTASPFYLSMVMLFYSLIRKLVGKKYSGSRILRKIAPFTFVIAPLLLLWICYKAPTSLYFKINDLVNGRLELSKNGLSTFGVHPFGQKVHFTTLDIFGNFSSNYNFIDSSYIQLIVIYGVIYTILILLMLFFTMKYIVKTRNEFLIVAMILISIHSMFDPQLLVLWYSPFALLIGRSFMYVNIKGR
ncbi:hypothetical protein PSA85_04645 [Limosilactobacillus reuteri]|uniref:hypothetical protein n=1 Tax=Limosilactobacillus reuteri TaxID=1598 RepID=UPI00235ED53F|nr:hypothetical protein [Limosilactobacillus reuteri]MDD1406666.1 hypothetical protein [Limosilactobacillus reuteri]